MSMILLGLMAGSVASASVTATASCGGAQPVVRVTFPPGSSVLSVETKAAQARAIAEQVGGHHLVSYRVLAMGDMQEGAEWDAASVPARLADQALARARGQAVQRMLAGLPRRLRTRQVSARLLPNRPVLAAAWSEPGSQRIGVVVEIGVMWRDANGIYIAC